MSKTYGTSEMKFELDEIVFRTYRVIDVNTIVMFTSHKINREQYVRARAIAERAFEIMDRALQRSLCRIGGM